jgi:ring-1,2-phenylacetyl-CoA epoxidase subunit PaaC
MVRQFFFDTWHYFLMRGLVQSSDPRIAEIAEKSIKEVTYHLRRSGDLVVRLGDGTPVSHARCRPPSTSCGPTPARCSSTTRSTRPWWSRAWPRRRTAARSLPAARRRSASRKPRCACRSPDAYMQRGGKQGRHGERLGYILAEMQFLQRAYPGVEW